MVRPRHTTHRSLSALRGLYVWLLANVPNASAPTDATCCRFFHEPASSMNGPSDVHHWASHRLALHTACSIICRCAVMTKGGTVNLIVILRPAAWARSGRHVGGGAPPGAACGQHAPVTRRGSLQGGVRCEHCLQACTLSCCLFDNASSFCRLLLACAKSTATYLCVKMLLSSKLGLIWDARGVAKQCTLQYFPRPCARLTASLWCVAGLTATMGAPRCRAAALRTSVGGAGFGKPRRVGIGALPHAAAPMARGYAESGLPPHTELEMPALSPTMSQARPTSPAGAAGRCR